MEVFYQTHAYLVEHTNAPVHRTLMDEIDWNHRLIGIKGTRGVGKTTFLLQYAKEYFGKDRSCLYVNMNNFYFQNASLIDFAGEFIKRSGKVLLIDQVFKHPNWSHELRMCYDRYPELKIVFTGSSVMRLKEENPELKDIVKSYNLRGFSFREFLNLQTNNNFPIYTLDDISGISNILRLDSDYLPVFYIYTLIKDGDTIVREKREELLASIGKNVGLRLKEKIVGVLKSQIEQMEGELCAK